MGRIWGAGLRPRHYHDWLNFDGTCTLEIMVDNYLYHEGGPALYYLDQLREQFPIVSHGIGLNIGAMEPFDAEYLVRLKKFYGNKNPKVISDHCCFTGLSGHPTFDLLPFPRTEKMLNHLIEKINYLQDFLDRRFSVENLSRYIMFEDNDFDELEFLGLLSKATGCGILLDVNNLFVSGFNEGFCPNSQLSFLEKGMVTQFHIAGHQQQNSYLFDSHDSSVIKPVWELLLDALKLFGDQPVILERDDEVSFEGLIDDWARCVGYGFRV